MNFVDTIIYRSPIAAYNEKLLDFAFQEALYISSPILNAEYKKNIDQNNSIENTKLHTSIHKYLTRASTRCTPFGLFAGLSIAKWGEKNNITFHSDLKKTLIRKTRLDMNVVCEIARKLSQDPTIRNKLLYFPNNTLYQVGGSLRYVEYFYQNNKRFHQISQVVSTPFLKEILMTCSSGQTLSELVNFITDDEINDHEAQEFIEELIKEQLIVSQLEPVLSGEDFYTHILNNLNTLLIDENSEIINTHKILKEIGLQIKEVDENIFNNDLNYEDILEKVQTLLPNATNVNLFQVDLYKNPLDSTIDSSIKQSLKEAVNFFNKITSNKSNPNLENFKKRFIDRYENNEVPLLVALDSEIGIGYLEKSENGINELVDDLLITEKEPSPEMKLNAVQSILLNIAIKATKENLYVTQLQESDFANINYHTLNLPHSLALQFRVLDSDTNKIIIRGVGGSTAIRLLARFSQNNDALFKIIKNIANHEQQQHSNQILAEIIHLPENRTGNILAHPCFRDYEIPYLAKSTLPSKNQILPQDLYISIVNNKILLRSKKLDKEIIPRLSNAHNFSYNSLPVYQFLCDLQTQYFDKSLLKFDWGVLETQFKFLPRIEFKNIVITPAKWRFTSDDCQLLLTKNSTKEQKITAFTNFKRSNKLPDLFILTEQDVELLINVKEEISVLSFLDEIKNKDVFLIEEFLFDPTKSLIKDSKKNNFTNECIAIILNENPIANILPQKRENIVGQIFGLGSEWIYYKIYCGVKTADTILINVIKPIIEELFDNKLIKKWFFIRYSDPEPHIRLRINISDIKIIHIILKKFNEKFGILLDEGAIVKVQTDDYKREIERYGFNTIDFAESFFLNDSIFVVNFLHLVDEIKNNEIRWLIAIRSTDQFLTDFNYSLEMKSEFMNSLSHNFFKEHGGDKTLKLQLDDKFRRNRKKIETILKEEIDAEFFEVIQLINERSLRNKLIITELFNIKDSGLLQVNVHSLVSSYIHMNLDRLFLSKNRTNEFVVYDSLSRFYKTVLAQSKTKIT